jgi:hypothetical protein
MSDIVALQTKLHSAFTYREFETDFGKTPATVQPKGGMLLSDLFARLQAQAPLPLAA